MLTINLIRENPDFVVERLLVKNLNAQNAINEILSLDNKKRELQVKTDSLQNEANNLSKEIGKLMATGKKEEAGEMKSKTLAIKEEVKVLTEELNKAETQLKDLLVGLPNIPHASVPRGKSPEENEEVRSGGVMPNLHPDALPHWDLIKKYDIIDFELGIKITGAGFPVYKREGAALQRALISWFLDQGIKAGYDEVLPPIVVNEDSGFGTGQLPDKEGQMYHVTIDNFYLIPTAEVPVTNLYRDVIIEADKLPVKNIAYTPCFRREAGSWGAHVRGLNRLHQFDKVEIVQITNPDNSYDALEQMVAHVESLVARLELPYRIIRLCGGDMSFTSALTYDFEVYSAAQKRWLEVSSVSNFESFQANRLKCRYRDSSKQNKLVHTLNGSALALPRIVAAILENYQTPEGIVIPEVLRKYTGFDIIS